MGNPAASPRLCPQTDAHRAPPATNQEVGWSIASVRGGAAAGAAPHGLNQGIVLEATEERLLSAPEVSKAVMEKYQVPCDRFSTT